jgi:hypothetical protein
MYIFYLFGVSSQPLAAKGNQLPIGYSAACGGVVYYRSLFPFGEFSFIEKISSFTKEKNSMRKIIYLLVIGANYF